jgi:hypothetical protein
VLDASSSPDGYGIEVSGPDGSGSTIEGWTAVNAQFSGILVGSHIAAPDGTPLTGGSPISNVTIDHVVVVNNNKGFSGVVGAGAGECFTTPFAPGDCGEGIHLVSATDSVVEHALITHNAGGRSSSRTSSARSPGTRSSRLRRSTIPTIAGSRSRATPPARSTAT